MLGSRRRPATTSNCPIIFFNVQEKIVRHTKKTKKYDLYTGSADIEISRQIEKEEQLS